MRKIALVFFTLLTLTGLFADGSQAFELDLRKDLIIGTTSLAVFTTGYLIKDSKDENKDAFGWFDEGSPFKYDSTLDEAGTLLGLSTLLTLPFLIDSWEMEDMTTIGVMYLEAALLTYGIKDILKGTISRPRPYVHRDDTDLSLLNEHDSYFSFPSGHTSIAFMTASFSTYVFSQGESSNKLKWTMGISSFSIATLTGILRVTSGAHYPTDVLVGAIFGSGMGFIVPYSHKVFPENISLAIAPGFAGVAVRL